MKSMCAIKNLYSVVTDHAVHETIYPKHLSKVNNYFEVISGDTPARVFIDLDGYLHEDLLSKLDEIHQYILTNLKTLEGVSIMSSSSQSANKLSFRLTYVNEYCNNMTDMRKVIKNMKFKEIKRLLKNDIPVKCGASKEETMDCLNIDMSVYKNEGKMGKMRCVNAWKTEDDKSRINKLEVGDIVDTFIHHIPEGCNLWEIEQETEKEAPTKEAPKKEQPDVLKAIKMMALRMKCFDGYNEWLQLCFIIHNESNGSQEGKECFIDICKKVCTNYNEEECNKKWYSLKSAKDKKLTVATLYKKFYEMFPEEKSKNKEGKFSNPGYITEKAKFEKRIFKLDTPFSYVKINANNSFEFLEEAKLKQWAKGEFNKIVVDDGEDCKEINFTDVWIEDPNKLVKNEMVFDPDPNNDNSKNFNFFKGFDFDDEMEPVIEEDSNFLQLLKKLTVENHVYEYFKQWIGHIIQFPHLKTNAAIVLYSDTKGIGKNCIVEGITRLFKGYTGKVESIKDITKNFNAHLCNKLFIYGDEICAKAGEVSDALKNTITRETQVLEKKGKDALYVKDFSNWLFTTNNFNAFKVESKDRRLGMIHCCEEKLSLIDSTAFFKEINNPDEINKLYNYFKKVKFTYNIVADSPPMTEYKKTLEYNNKPGYLQALFKDPNRFVGCSMTSTELLKNTNEYSKNNYLAQTVDVTTFGKVMGVIFSEQKKRGATANRFNFEKINKNQFNQILYNYDKDYWKYVNHYDSIDEPDFTKVKKEKTVEETNDLDM